MDKQALAQLKDIHSPSPVGIWPLAPGWWALILVLSTLLLIGCWWAWTVYKRNRAKKKALKLLQSYKHNYLNDDNASKAASELSTLLRRVALAYYPRRRVASLTGEAWIDFLDTHSKTPLFVKHSELLLITPYQANASCAMTPLFEACEAWIKQRGKR